MVGGAISENNKINKTIKEIEIEDLVKEVEEGPLKYGTYAKFKRRKKVISNTIKSLRFLIAYLETNPSEDLIKAQKTSVDKKDLDNQ